MKNGGQFTAQGAHHCTLPGVILSGPPTGSTFHLSSDSCVDSSFTGTDLVQYSGCGYPFDEDNKPEAWLGNCPATALLLGGADPGKDGDEVQGTFCDTIKSASIEIAIHSLDAPATVCTNFIADSSAGHSGQIVDPDSVALWLDQKTTKSQYDNGRLGGGYNSILNTPRGEQPDGVGISNVQAAGHIALGTGSNMTLIAPHGQTAPDEAAPTVFASSGANLTQIVGANLHQWTVASDSPAGLAALSCSANVFATAPCGQVKTAPICAGTGCVSVSGNDGGFDVAVSSGTSIFVQLAGQYAAAPVCQATVSTGGGGSLAIASISSVDFKPWGTVVGFKVTSGVTHIYGSCRGPTG